MRNLNSVFSNNECNIIPYCTYHDLQVNAVIDSNGTLSICDKDTKETYTMFYLSEDRISEGVIVKSMKFSTFIKESRKLKVKYIDLCNTTQCLCSRAPLDKVDMFTKSEVNEFIRINPELTDKFFFLREDSIIVHSDSDAIIHSETITNRIIKKEIHRALQEVLDEAKVESFHELFRLVKLGKGIKLN